MICEQKTCTLFNSCKKFSTRIFKPKETPSKVIDVLLVYASAARYDERTLQETRAGKYLRSYLIKHYTGPHKISFGIMGLLRSQTAETATSEDWDLCFVNSVKDIITLRPKVILALGMASYTALLQKSDKKTPELLSFNHERLYGQAITFGEHTCKILPTFSPQRALGSSNLDQAAGVFSLIISDFQKVLINPSLTPYSTKDKTIKLLKKVKHVERFVDLALTGPHKTIVCDTETRNRNRKFNNCISLMQFSLDDQTAYVIPYAHPDSPFTPSEQKKIRKLIRKLFLTSKAPFQNWLFANSVFDLHQFYREFNINPFAIKKYVLDVLLAAHALNENRLKAKTELPDGYFSLKVLAREYLMFKGYDEGNILEQRAKGILHDLPLEGPLLRYAADDVFVPRALIKVFLKHAKFENFHKKLLIFLRGYVNQASRVITEIEHNGLPMDVDQIRLLKSPNSPILQHLETIESKFKKNKATRKTNDKILNLSERRMKTTLFKKPWVFSLSKPAHLKTLFFDILKLKPVTYSAKTNMPSVDAKFQNEYENTVKEVGWFSKWKSANTLKTFFIEPMYEQVSTSTSSKDSGDFHVRPHVFLGGTVTGRVSVSNPNTQQLPSGTDTFARETKSVFKSPPGYHFVEIDYQASEVRWLCNLARDHHYAETFNTIAEVIRAYRVNPNEKTKKKMVAFGDPHKHTAAMIMDIPVKDVTKPQRKNAKAVTFGLIYGMMVYTLSINLKLSIAATEALVNKFFERFPASKEYLFKVEREAGRKGYVDAPSFRRRHLPGMSFVDDKKLVAESKRLARNSPIQGISSEGSLIGAALLGKFIYKEKLDWRLSNGVHDSLWAVVPSAEVSDFIVKAERFCTTGVQKHMEKYFGFEMICPLAVDFKIGKRLGYTKDLDFKHFQNNKLDLEYYSE